MFQNEFSLLPKADRAHGSPAVTAGAPFTAPVPHATEAVPASKPLPTQRGRSEGARLPQGQCHRDAVAGFTPILTGLAGIVQWIYYPPSWPDF